MGGARRGGVPSPLSLPPGYLLVDSGVGRVVRLEAGAAMTLAAIPGSVARLPAGITFPSGARPGPCLSPQFPPLKSRYIYMYRSLLRDGCG